VRLSSSSPNRSDTEGSAASLIEEVGNVGLEKIARDSPYVLTRTDRF
jgi:hypothetical protein